MYERELTHGGSYQYHTCVDKFDDYDIDLYDYECNITPKNKTSPHDYIHVSCLKKGIDKFVRRSVLEYFNIPVDFPVVYFTRKVPFTPEFKCGFYLNTFKKFKSDYFEQTLNTIKLFKGLYNDIFLAGDFDKDGSFIDESINIEIMPIQSKDNYFVIRKILNENYMSSHLSLRSGNPVLSKKTFDNTISVSEKMTIEGTVNKTGVSLLILVGTGYLTFDTLNPILLVGCGIGGFIFALVTIFKKEWAPITVPIYAALQGAMLGGISYMYNYLYDGIVTNAILLTVGILVSLLIAYRSGYIKATENFKLGIFAATGGIAIVYLVNFIMGFFGTGIGVLNINNASPLSIGFSIVVVIIAALNLVLDFDFIEEGAEKGAPKYMEWYGAFGLLVTLIWLYLEILRLLAKLNSRK